MSCSSRFSLKRVRVVLLTVLIGMLVIASPANSRVVTRTITYDHDGVTLEGYLAYDDELTGQRPGVMIVHQWMGPGDYEETRARRLAELGYVAFAADVYGADTRPNTTHEASLAASTFREDRNRYRRRLRVSLNTLRSFEKVKSNKLAAIGYCFGGTGVLELARSGADIEAAVSFHGGLANPNPQKAAAIRSKVQVHHGAKDPHVTRDDVHSFWTEMNEHATVGWDLNVYSNAPHGFTEPGTDAYVKRADRLSWTRMRRLFKNVLND